MACIHFFTDQWFFKQTTEGTTHDGEEELAFSVGAATAQEGDDEENTSADNQWPGNLSPYGVNIETFVGQRGLKWSKNIKQWPTFSRRGRGGQTSENGLGNQLQQEKSTFCNEDTKFRRRLYGLSGGVFELRTFRMWRTHVHLAKEVSLFFRKKWMKQKLFAIIYFQMS